MPISKNDVKYIANLARLRLNESEAENFQTQLEVILEYIDKLKKVDISNTQPTAHVMEIENVYRGDEIKPSLDVSKVFKISPLHKEDFFVVPKVIE